MVQSSPTAWGLASLSLPNDTYSFAEISLVFEVMEFKELIYSIFYYSDLWRFLIFSMNRLRISASLAKNQSRMYIYILSTPGPTIPWE